ncbi:MAG: hypothetical protein H6662_13245 [Ardenticatenaceae bacterium]|nr:hypothetical protein [Ardenticatenaceae bacterium]
MSQYIDPVHLRQVLTQYYNDSELHTMCFDLGIDYEDIGGRGKTEKVVELLGFAQRNNRLDDIAAYVRRTRPFVQLQMTDTLPPLPAVGIGSGTSITVHVAGDFVGGDKVEGDKVTGDKITVGNISGSSGVAIGRGAAATVTTITQAAPQSQDDFRQQLQALQAMLAKAIADGDFADADDAQDAADDLDKALDEAKKDTPRADRLANKLEAVTKTIETGAKTGAAILKATPIIAALIKAASAIF